MDVDAAYETGFTLGSGRRVFAYCYGAYSFYYGRIKKLNEYGCTRYEDGFEVENGNVNKIKPPKTNRKIIITIYGEMMYISYIFKCAGYSKE